MALIFLSTAVPLRTSTIDVTDSRITCSFDLCPDLFLS